MTALQKTIVTAAIVVTAGVGIYEAREASSLRDQVRSLQQQEEQIQELQRERDNAVNRLSAVNEQLRMTMEDSNELVRLRAETARLRGQADADASELKEARDFQSRVTQLYSNTPPIRTFVSTTTTTVSWGQAIVTGGWKTPSGRRVIVLLKVQPADTPEQVLIDSTILEYTEEAGAAIGLTQFNVDGPTTQQKARKIDADQLESILAAAKADNNGGINILSAPMLTTASEQQAEIRSGPRIHSEPPRETYIRPGSRSISYRPLLRTANRFTS